jgi:transposase-like protein
MVARVCYICTMKVTYTIKEFNEQFPDDDACLDYMFDTRWPNGGTCKCGKSDCFHRVRGFKKYACQWCGAQISPLAGTIFHKSSTPLRTWFHALFIITASRNGVSAMELMRQVGVAYNTAWRMNHQLRALMAEDMPVMSGIIEADETYIGGKRKGKRGRGAEGKTKVAGLLERGGDVNATVVQDCKAATLVPNITRKVTSGSTICTDELGSYNKLAQHGYAHERVNHSKGEVVCGEIHVNGMESFWAQFKRSVDGTFHHISPSHTQKYLNEFSYRSNHRHDAEPMFCQLAATAHEQHAPAV